MKKQKLKLPGKNRRGQLWTQMGILFLHRRVERASSSTLPVQPWEVRIQEIVLKKLKKEKKNRDCLNKGALATRWELLPIVNCDGVVLYTSFFMGI